jgi:hypothetical protein
MFLQQQQQRAIIFITQLEEVHLSAAVEIFV